MEQRAKQAAVQPLVVFSIFTHYLRRKPEQNSVIGALLGKKRVSTSGYTYEVTNSIPVPHESQEDNVAVGKDALRQLQILYERANPDELLIGWYLVAPELEIDQKIFMIDDFFAMEANDPFLLYISSNLVQNFKNAEKEGNLKSETIVCKGYVSETLQIGDKDLAACFYEIPVSTEASNADKIALDAMYSSATKTVKGKFGVNCNVASQMENTQDVLRLLLKLLEKVNAYLARSEKGEKCDPKILEKIRLAFDKVPKIDPSLFAKSFNQSLHDLLMLAYLSNLTRSQIGVAEKLAN